MADVHHPLDELVVITGFSGAGKSEAMACFEDAGYFCVDNLPPALIGALADVLQHEGSKVERAAIASDVRAGEYLDELARVLDQLEDRGLHLRVVFLEASEPVLLRRFTETRRRHPLAPEGRVAEGIAAERQLLEPLKSRANNVIDTSDLTTAMLRRQITRELLPRGARGKLAITLMSFGFKNGAPHEADLVFDVRFFRNPHYVAELRKLTGQQRPVIDYVEESHGYEQFFTLLEPLLEFLIPSYIEEGKAHLVIAIGCTGGRHRSVVITERLAALLGERDDAVFEVVHRDIERPR